jgi:prolyl-tRNA synthetase
MRLSALFVPTLREDPEEAEVPSHRLLLRAAYIRQVAAGVYTTLPLGLRSIRKIERIVREEMDATGAQEIRMPILLPSEPWKATGRWDLYGDTLFRLTDRHDREMLLGPTQEEVVAGLVAAELPSYRDLPVNLYQIEWKYRDEFRPRFGLLRGREFLMKDAYTFDHDEEGMVRSYDAMLRAYRRVFDRWGSRTSSLRPSRARSAGVSITSSWPAPTWARTCSPSARTATTSPISRRPRRCPPNR